MGQLSPVLRSLEGGMVAFRCPGCKHVHALRVRSESAERPSWEYNGDPEKPTFSPSILVTWKWRDESKSVCHSFVRNGQIEFLGDCTHELAGKTVELQPWDASEQQGEG